MVANNLAAVGVQAAILGYSAVGVSGVGVCVVAWCCRRTARRSGRGSGRRAGRQEGIHRRREGPIRTRLCSQDELELVRTVEYDEEESEEDHMFIE